MQKVITLLIMSLVVVGCSLKYSRRTVENTNTKGINQDKLLELVSRQNISNESFIIQKVDIEIIDSEGVEKMIANVRYTKPGKYLISVRNKLGIEAARIFIGTDTILINDRINRKLYCASSKYFNTKYTVPISLLPVLFGDYVGEGSNREILEPCDGGMVTRETSSGGVKINYQIDCDKAKIISSRREASLNTGGILIKYSDFFITGDKYIPGTIELRDVNPGSVILIKFRDIISPWNGIIEFIPGNRYEIVNML